VLVDSPGYYPLFGKLRLAKVTAVPVGRLPAGPDLDDLAAKAAAHDPKLFFTQSQAHNPTGGTLSPAVAFGLLQAAETHGFRIVEDDVFADMLPASLPRLAAFGQQERVLYVGSFSKTLSASLRCGYVAGAPEIVRSLVDIKMLTTVATSAHVERLIMALIESGQYRRHLRRLRARVEEAAKGSVEALAAAGLEVEIPKVPGFYLWTPLPEATDEVAFCRAAAACDIFVAPGRVFRVEGDEGPPAMRVNVAYGADPRFVEFLKGELG
jgi:DNA-binding transcriptional MocR family regulator